MRSPTFASFAGAAALIRPNLKLIAHRPDREGEGCTRRGWGSGVGVGNADDRDGEVGPELEAITIGLAYAF